MFIKKYEVKDEHIDVQGIMDGLYYPFYMEDCRHEFVNDVIGFDIVGNAQNGINIVLAEYTIKFFRSLKKGDVFDVTCEVAKDIEIGTSFTLKQEIKINGKKFTEGAFVCTCVKATGGRQFLTEELKESLQKSAAEQA